MLLKMSLQYFGLSFPTAISDAAAPIPTFGNHCLSVIGGGKQQLHMAGSHGWVQLSVKHWKWLLAVAWANGVPPVPPYSGVLNSRTYRSKWTLDKICRKTNCRTPTQIWIGYMMYLIATNKRTPGHRFSQKWQLRVCKWNFRVCKMPLLMKIPMKMKELW